MTPKEKAKRLTGKYYEEISEDMTFEQAKQCASLAVDEIINLCAKGLS